MRKLVDCCSRNRKRINGDASLTGYCYKGRRSSASCTSRRRCRVDRRARSPPRLAAGITGAWSPCGFSMVETLAPRGLRRAPAHDAARVRDVRRRRARRRRDDVRRRSALLGQGLGAGGTGALGGRRRRRDRRRGRRGARRADRPAGAPAGAGVVAARAAGAAGGRPLRRAAGARLHDLHPHLRRVGAGGGRASRSATRRSGRARASRSAPAARCR